MMKKKTIFNIVSLSRKINANETLLLIISIILEITSSSFLYFAKKMCGGQCLLFAKLYERARILRGSSPSWCYLPIVFNLAAITSSVFVLRSRKGRRSRSSGLRVLGLVSFSAFLVFLSSWIISSGFREFCRSFVINKHVAGLPVYFYVFYGWPMLCDCSQDGRRLKLCNEYPFYKGVYFKMKKLISERKKL
ncbi:uncharacterized protein LOC111338258 isoform X2 [Stylophora pistillata]|uniref:uncharacterized protein LOC111338258 isoform X2 n=1 Tax=Stylophora pistillata TaxID=50429 RepID=UPI000C03A120|nr:uncharacterized protein LOC111338258 isoform X2 [Stylophora pistillata]